MSNQSSRRHLPSGVLRWMFRTPIWLYRAQLGWAFGNRFLMLTHTGRKSGRKRYVVVEVVYHSEIDDTYYIASGWGEKADWYRNIRHEPNVTIQVGTQKSKRVASRVPVDQAANIYLKYATRYPNAFQRLGHFMTGKSIAPTLEGCREVASVIPLVALQLRADNIGERK